MCWFGKILMAQIVLKLQLITPLLMFGAFNGGYRLRAVYGAAYGSNITGLHEAESRIFGSTLRGSAVTVRVQHSLRGIQSREFVVLPEKVDSNRGKVDHKFPGFEEADKNPDQSFLLSFISHPLSRDVFNPAFISALFLAFTLGGFGKRARRGGGALQIVNQSDDDLPDILKPLNMPDGAALAVELKKRFSEIQQAIDGLPDLRDEEGRVLPKRPYAATDIPAYPIFAPDHCRVFVGTKGESDYLTALKQIWRITGTYHRVQAVDNRGRPLTRTNRRGEEEPILDRWAWGYVRGSERRASALNMRVYQCDDGKYYPIVTIFRGGRRDEKWGRVQKVIDLFAEPRNNFTRAYGTGADWT
jgi:CRISPR type III-B/RAMP module RAMP protein Cmr1